MSDKPVTLCLNMIVKNESRIILRLLESVLPIIDTYVICDTGSTDNTPAIITDFFNSHGIRGEVINEPFKNFGYNRTFALKAARGKATYALLLDADMIFRIEPSFNKQLLTKHGYLIIQKGGNLSYHNVRLIRLDIDAKCLGPTHEYYDFPPGSETEKLNSLWIDDIGDGGCKADKFDRDIRLLKQGIEEEPTNGRYYFYLANSYFNSGRHGESIPYYKKRIELGGWYEEIFYSHLNLGHAYMSTGQPEQAVFTWIAAYNLHSGRAETIYEITKYYREKGMNKIAMAFCMLGKSIPYPKNDSLFIHNDVYETGFDYELSILGFYNNHPNLHKVACKLLDKLPNKWDNILSNYKFYCPKLSQFQTRKIHGLPISQEIDVCGTVYKMNGSNPCIFKMGSQYMMNVRLVNYILQPNGSYVFPVALARQGALSVPVDDGKIVTVNRLHKLDGNFNYIDDGHLMIPTSNNLRYVGIEDFKPYMPVSSSGGMHGIGKFLGTIQSPRTGNISIGYGILDLNIGEAATPKCEFSVVETQWNKGCEKNWVFFDEDRVIYSWFPLTIGKIIDKQTQDTDTDKNQDQNQGKNDNEIGGDSVAKKPSWFLELLEEKQMPNFFRHVRGSTHGCEFQNEIWFLCHAVEYSQPREYYHFFAVFDKATMNIKRWSHLFKFEGEKIEYALGLIVECDRIIVSYSKWDREPAIGVYDKFRVEMEMF